jgi:hypothetical protein
LIEASPAPTRQATAPGRARSCGTPIDRLLIKFELMAKLDGPASGSFKIGGETTIRIA